MRDCYYDLGSNSIADLIKVSGRDTWVITRINVPKLERGKGHATVLLKKILDDADRECISLCLAVSPSDGLDYEQLIAWYTRHGFERDKQQYLWTHTELDGLPEDVQRGLMRRDPQPVVPRIDVIFTVEEIDHIRIHPDRCICGHLALFHHVSTVLIRTASSVPMRRGCALATCICMDFDHEKESDIDVSQFPQRSRAEAHTHK